MLYLPNLLKQRWMRICPDLIDSVLLISAITLVIKLQQYPFVDAWLTAKVLALLLYIVFGSIALRRGRTKKIRLMGLVGALLTAGYIVWVAVTHNPYPWL